MRSSCCDGTYDDTEVTIVAKRLHSFDGKHYHAETGNQLGLITCLKIKVTLHGSILHMYRKSGIVLDDILGRQDMLY
jgi:hypothetical protein